MFFYLLSLFFQNQNSPRFLGWFFPSDGPSNSAELSNGEKKTVFVLSVAILIFLELPFVSSEWDILHFKLIYSRHYFFLFWSILRSFHRALFFWGEENCWTKTLTRFCSLSQCLGCTNVPDKIWHSLHISVFKHKNKSQNFSLGVICHFFNRSLGFSREKSKNNDEHTFYILTLMVQICQKTKILDSLSSPFSNIFILF